MIILEVIKDVIIIITALVASLAAILGLSAWKKQLIGRNDYELARRYLRAVYKMRNAIRYVRNPFIPIAETTSALKKKGLQESDFSDKKKVDWAVYSLRWEKISEAFSDLEIESIEGEVSWGKKLTENLENLYKLINELSININHYIDKDSNLKVNHSILYGLKDDDFDKKIQTVVINIENYLRDYLR